MSNNTQKKEAYKIVNKARRDGLLPDVKGCLCWECDEPADHYHHEDYNKPLDVIPLCQICHQKKHNPPSDNDKILSLEEARKLVFQHEKQQLANETENNGRAYDKTETLAQRANLEIVRYGSIIALSRAIDVNPGVIWRVKNGGNSPTLRRLWSIPKHPPRVRLNIDCDVALVARFDTQRGDMSRGEYLERLLDLEWRL